MVEIIPELIPWGVLLLVFIGMATLQWRVINAMDQALERLSPVAAAAASPVVPLPPPPVAPLVPPPVILPPQPQPPVPVPVPAPAPAPSPAPSPFVNAPNWFQWALREVGFRETGNNQGIGRYISLAHVGAEGDPWCAIFVNAALESSGVVGTRSASSQSFRTNANFVQLSGPCLGAIAVFWRGSKTSGLGHVGFYRGEDANSVWSLGGNENDMVMIEALNKNNPSFGLIGYWWPRAVPMPVVGSITMPAGSPVEIQVPPVDKPTTAVNGVYTNITATLFSGSHSAYGAAIDDSKCGVALPFHFTGARPRVRITGKKNGVSVDCDIVDVGPWNINDPYWQTGTRPEAETGTDLTGRKTNGAGIDLTIAAATAAQIDGKGLVDWQFITDAT